MDAGMVGCRKDVSLGGQDFWPLSLLCTFIFKDGMETSGMLDEGCRLDTFTKLF